MVIKRSATLSICNGLEYLEMKAIRAMEKAAEAKPNSVQ